MAKAKPKAKRKSRNSKPKEHSENTLTKKQIAFLKKPLKQDIIRLIWADLYTLIAELD